MSENYAVEGEKPPILILTCQRDSHPFRERTIVLDEIIQVGRSVARAKPSDTNAIFDCKVLSRSHALIWHKNGRFWLRDTNSSNGTFVNNTRLVKRPGELFADREIFSGDIIRFGVDVVENETTHGCIIACVTLFQPSGQEAKLTEPVGSANGVVALENLHSEQVFRLAHFVTEALFREQELENKLDSMSRLLQETREMSEAGWQAMLNEERLLHTLDLYECQLSALKQDLPPDSIQARLCQLIEEKVNLEKASEAMLNRLVKEKSDALGKVTILECRLSDYERECARLRQECETTNEAYQTVMRDFNTKVSTLTQLEKQIKDVQTEKDRLESQLKERVKEADVLQEKLVQQMPVNANPPKASLASDRVPSINGYENGPVDNPEHVDDQVSANRLLESSLNERAERLRQEIAISEPEVRNRLMEIQARLTDSEGDLEHIVSLIHEGLSLQLTHSLHQFDESTRLIKLLLAEIDLFFALSGTYGSSPQVSKALANDEGTSETTPDNNLLQATCLRIKNLTTQVTNSQLSLEASLNACFSMQERLQHAPSVSKLAGDNSISVCDVGEYAKPSSDASVQTASPVVSETVDSEPHSIHLIDTASQSYEDQTELSRLKEQLQLALVEAEDSRQLANSYKLQDSAKADLLLTVREECDTLRKRIASIEAEMVTSREDHQRLVSEARRTRSEAEELRRERDVLNLRVGDCARRIEQLQAALVTDSVATDGDLLSCEHSDSVTSVPSAPLHASSRPIPQQSLGTTISLFVAVPVMILLLALILYVHSKFT